MKYIIILLALSAAGISSTTAQKIAMAKVPASVLKTFHTKYPTATTATWEMEGKDKYEVNYRLGKEKQSAVYDREGKWLETEMELQTNDLPKVVAEAIAMSYPQYKIKEANRVDTPDKGLIYEADITKGTELMEVQLSPEGKVLKAVVEKK